MTGSLEWILSGISGLTLIGVGITYGDARARLIRIEKCLFNGNYATKEEMDIRVTKATKDHEIVNERLNSHGDRIRTVEIAVAREEG